MSAAATRETRTRAARPFGVLAAGALSVLAATAPVGAHEVRPGYLEIREIDANAYDVLWKVPAKGDLRLALYVAWPRGCEVLDVDVEATAGAFVERGRIECDGGLVGREIFVDGLAATQTDVLVRVERAAEAMTQTVRLTADSPGFVVTAAPDALDVARTYFDLGVEHIVFGVDHLLFVLALLFLTGSWPRLVGTVTAFTLAHSITLVAATMGWLQVPQAPVEAVIALSVVFVAVEVVHERRGRVGLAARKPWIVAFAFGLLHGLGFAGALRELGLPARHVPLALGFFNVGVEAGQLGFVAVAFALVFAASRAARLAGFRAASSEWRAMERASGPAAYVIGTIAAFWLIERTVAFTFG